MILEDISYNDLIEVVLENFGIDVSPSKLNSINLSYVSPSKLNFSSKELPPVFIRNDRQVASYMNKLQENGCLHLCITIKVTTWNSLRTHLSSRIVSNTIQTRDEVLITHNLHIAGNSNPP
ncbi:unnamed protein product [Brassica rapa subsp. narinosa]